MSIPTNAQILTQLDRLDTQTADDLETQWLEFKPWTGPRDDMRVAIEYAVCFANAEGGVIIFGVADRTRGRAAAIHGIGRCDLDIWRRDIFNSTRPHLEVAVEELTVPEGTGRLLVVRVPKGPSPPYGTMQGVFKQRVGKNAMPMDPHAFARAQACAGIVDWSGLPAEGVEVGDLDLVEIARARNVRRRFKPQSELLKVDDAALLVGVGAVRHRLVTRAGLLLFGREQMLSEICPQHQVHYVHQVSETRVARNDSHRVGLLNILERIEQAFTGPANPEHEVSVGLFKLRIPAFVVDVVREALLNAVTHRDYTDPNEVLLRHAVRELAVTSPGGFLGGITPKNILRHEPVPRNRTRAEAFEKLGLVERAGMGRRRIFIPTLSYGKRSPLYETDGLRVTLRIFDGSFSEKMAVLVAKWRGEGRDVDLDALLVLGYLLDHAFIDTLTAADLLQLSRDDARGALDQLGQLKTGILERKGKTEVATHHLTKAVAKDLLGKAAYTRTKGLDPLRYAEMVRAFVQDHGSIAPRECRELLGLGESASAKVDVSRYLKKWSADSPPDSEAHLRLVSTLLKTVASSHAEVISHRGGNFVRFDKGLSIISQHAASLGYDAVILFLDELILWLAMNSADLGFVKREAAKLTNLVEAQSAARPIPLVSFVARQRDLRELVGDHVPGAERLSFGDALDWQGGRFDTITLEDRNLPAIAEKRVLRCKSESARKELDAAFEQTARLKDNVMSILLTQEGDRQMFRKVYPFSPALVQTLIAVSSVLQRERSLPPASPDN